MKSNEKRGILILIVVVLIIVAILHGILKQNNNEGDGQLVQLEGFKLSDVDVKTEGGKTTLIANVTNKTGEDKGIIPVYIVLLGEEKNELGRIQAVVTETKFPSFIQLNVCSASRAF